MLIPDAIKYAWTEGSASQNFVPIDIFDLQVDCSIVDSVCTHSKLFVSGTDTGTEIYGQVLDSQFQIGEYFLLLTNLNTGYDSSVEVTLLNKEYDLIAHQSLDHLPSTVQIHEIEIRSANSCDIFLSDGQTYRIRVKPFFLSVFWPLRSRPRLRIVRV